MNSRVPDAIQDMDKKTVEALQDLVRALRDSSQYLNEAADHISGDDFVKTTLRSIAAERGEVCANLGSYIAIADEKPVEDGTFLGSLRKIWTSFRAGLNAGDATVVLIEAERAEDVIVHKFQEVLPTIAGNPINDKLNEYFKLIKTGHDRVLKMRNAHQNK